MSTVIGINLSHDTSVCLIKDGTIFAAEEERWTKVKHNSIDLPQTRLFPQKALNYVLEASHTLLDDVDQIVCVSMAMNDIVGETLPVCEELAKHKNVQFISHHKAHILSGFLLSPYSSAVGLCIDGAGSFIGLDYNLRERVSGYFLSNDVIQRIYSNDDKIYLNSGKIAKQKNSLGNFYRNFALRCVPKGDEPEGSMMALASYAESEKYYLDIQQLISLYPEGKFQISEHYGTRTPLPYYFGGIEWTIEQKNQISFVERANMAWAVQKVFEDTVIHILNSLYKQTNIPNLIFSGGCALNSKLNGRIANETSFKNVYIPPAPHDGGTALGAALYAWNFLLKMPRISTPTTLDWGTELKNLSSVDEASLEKKNIKISKCDLISKSAQLLLEDNVIIWAQGKMEFGPRALGNRSIIANPGNLKIKERVNLIKKRATYRPLAPSVLENCFSTYFDGDSDYYMNKTAMVRTPEKLPAISHKDGSARVQLVTPSSAFYDLLMELYQIDQMPIILNTSLNLKGIPIANNTHDVLDIFLKLDVDAAVIGNVILSKPYKYVSGNNTYSICCFSPQRIRKVCDFLAELYKDRKRDQNTPFINHPLEVVSILQKEFGCSLNDDYLLIALLHDALWVDYFNTKEKIRSLFGEVVLAKVSKLTKPHIVEQREKHVEDEKKFVDNVLACESELIYIKFADRLHNLRECAFSSESKKQRFIVQTKQYYLPIIQKNAGNQIWDTISMLFNKEFAKLL